MFFQIAINLIHTVNLQMENGYMANSLPCWHA